MSHNAPDNNRHDPTMASLGRYWDEVVRARPAEPGNLEPTLAETVHRLHARDDAPGADVAFAARLLVTLQDHMAAMLLDMSQLAAPLPLDPPATNGRTPATWPQLPLPYPTSPRRPAWPLAHIASAALVAITLAFAFLVVGPPPRGGPDEQTAEAPAAVDTVFSTTLPAAQVPTAGNLDFLFWRVKLEPNSRGPASAQPATCCPGPQITHVLEGDLTLHVAGPARIFRGGEMAPGGMEVPPYSDLILRAGDTAVFDYATPAEYANQGTQPVQLVGGGIFAGAVRGGPAGTPLLDYNEAYSIPALPAGPLDATLRRATLPPGGEIPAPTSGALVLDVGAFGDADIAQRPDGALRNIGVDEETIYVLTLTPLAATDGVSTIPPA
jgi:hypothetical protein